MTISGHHAMTLQSLILQRIEQQNLSYAQIVQSMAIKLMSKLKLAP